MKRRDLIIASASALLPAFARGATPCPPPQISVSGGGSATTTCGSPSPGGSYSTTFAGTENPLSEGGAWVNGKSTGLAWNNIQSSGGRAGATHIMVSAPPYDDCMAHINPAFRAFAANQYAQGTVYRAPGYTTGHEVELLVRCSITANVARGYEVYWSTNGGLYIVRWNGPINNFTVLAGYGAGLANAGDVMRVEAAGSLITVKINGST